MSISENEVFNKFSKNFFEDAFCKDLEWDDKRRVWVRLLIACMLTNQQNVLNVPFEMYEEIDNYEIIIEHYFGTEDVSNHQRITIKKKEGGG